VLGVRDLRLGRLSEDIRREGRLYVTFRVPPCQCIIYETAIVDPTEADCGGVGYSKRAFRVDEEVAKGRKPSVNSMRKKPSGFVI
jgi:hypothetical protein